MLSLRNGHLSAFQGAAVRGFYDRAQSQLARCFPAQTNALGPKKLRAVIVDGHRRAKAHGLTAEINVYKYLVVMFAFGIGFEDGPLRAWAWDHLSSEPDRHENFRADDLFESASVMLREDPALQVHDVRDLLDDQ